MGIEAYNWVRGFNYQPSWGSHGLQIWLDFKPETYALEVDRGLKYFPQMNSLRVWLSYDAYIYDRQKFLEAVAMAYNILRERNIKIMPVFFNGWHTIPDFGGISSAMLRITRRRGEWAVECQYVEDIAKIISDPDDLLMFDLCNEPFCTMVREEEQLLTTDFLKAIAERLHNVAPKVPVTIGSWGIGKDWRPLWDIDLFDPFVDVISLHPYWITRLYSQDEYLNIIGDLLSHLRKLGKPVIVSECCWGTCNDDEKRVEIIRHELGWMAREGIGFMPHALHYSRVADLHADTYWPGLMYMQFIEADGSLRKGHEVYNEF